MTRPTAQEQQEQLLIDERNGLERAAWASQKLVDAALDDTDWRESYADCEALVEVLMDHQIALGNLQAHVLTHGREVENDLYAERAMEEIRRDPVGNGFLRVRQAS